MNHTGGTYLIDDLWDAKYDGSSLFLGEGAGQNDDAGASDGIRNSNTAVGKSALHLNTSGAYNSANGYQSLYNNTTGSLNTANGSYALYQNTTGSNNTANGTYALHYNTTGNYNSANGHNALLSNTIGNSNVGLGFEANNYNQEGSYNTIIGFQAGGGTSIHNKSGNVFLGYQAGYNELGDNKLYIENSTSTSPLIGGDFSTDEVYLNGNVGIGTQSPLAKLHLRGDDFPNSFMYLESDATKDAGFRLREDGVTKWHIYNNGSNQELSIRNNAYDPCIIIEQVTGNVGIGTSTPGYKLEVNGNAAKSSGGTSWSVSSDVRESEYISNR